MPAIKCPYCGHRNFQTSGKCTNCGTLLAPPTPVAPQEPPVVYKPALPKTISSAHQQTEEIMAVEPYAPRQVAPAMRPPSLHPTAGDTINLDPYRNQGFAPTIITEEKNIFVSQPPTSDNFPWWFPRRVPDISGQVIQVQSQQETLHSFDLLTAIVKMIRDIIWMDPHDHSQHNKEKETVFITRMRIRTTAGAQKDATMQGHFTGGNITLGDTVSLWGTRRRGILRVSRAFNHTSDAVVTTRAMASTAPFLLMLVLLLIALVAFALTHHLALPIPLPIHLPG